MVPCADEGNSRLVGVLDLEKREEGLMEKLLMGGAGYIFAIVGLVVLVTVGVMSILLPILVFRILSELAKINEKMNKIIASLNEAAKATREPQSQRQPEEARLALSVSKRSGPVDIGEKSLRFK